MQIIRVAFLSVISLILTFSAPAFANEPPVAFPRGATVYVGRTVTLDGSLSTDPDRDVLSHIWRLIQKPAGSAAEISDEQASNPTFVADLPGVYFVELTVSDGSLSSAPERARIEAVEKRLSLSSPFPILVGVGESIQGHVSVPFVSDQLVPPVTVTVTSSDPSVATVSPGAVFIKGSDSGGGVAPNSEFFTVRGVETGTVTLTATAPGYLPDTETITVQVPGTIHASNLLVGRGLYIPASVFLIPRPPCPIPVDVVITSGDPSVRLSRSENEAGTESIFRLASCGEEGNAVHFFVQSWGSTGTFELSVTALGYAPRHFKVTVFPSTFALLPPGPFPGEFITTTGSPNWVFNIATVMLHPKTNQILAIQPPVPGPEGSSFLVKSSNPRVGVVYPNRIQLRGRAVEMIQFDPLTPGTTTLSLATGENNKHQEIKVIVLP
jgi:hypothetical protein